MTFGIETLGCKVNLYESEYLINQLKKEGFIIKDFNDICDIYIINTCAVTNNGEVKSRKMVNSAIARNKNAIIVVCGCYIENNKNKNIDLSKYSIVVGNKNKDKIVSYIKDYLKNKKQIIDIEDIRPSKFTDMEIDNFNDKTRAFVKIEDGCDNFCSYCIIPFVRGGVRSKDKDKVIFEITNLVKKGYKEIVLTGIHTGHYGSDIKTDFKTLLKEILQIPKLERIRISSIEITELDDDVIELLKNPKICNHLHIPLQSGSDKILKLMNRKYDKKKFLEIINKIRKVRKDISITTDVIVGFPEEEDIDFDESMEFIKKVNFSKVHVFPYSIRTGTKAASMRQVDGKVKKERVKKLLDLSSKLEDSYYESFVGKSLKVLIEKVVDNVSYGHTSNYLYLKINKVLKENEIYDIVVEENMFPKVKI